MEDISVWVVDDHLLFRETLQDFINYSPEMYCSATFDSCEQLFTTISNQKLPEVLLMDINIPDKMSGIEGLKLFRQIAPRVRVLMLTLHSEDDKIISSLCHGASGYLIKTSDPDEIIQGILRAYHGDIALTSSVAHRLNTIFHHSLNRFNNKCTISAKDKQILKLLLEKTTFNESSFTSPCLVC